MNEHERDTERQPRVKFLWVGLGTDEIRKVRVWRYAVGEAHDQLAAQQLVLANLDRLGHGRGVAPGHESDPANVHEFGTLTSIRNAVEVYAIAQRMLKDECPWLVPMPTGTGKGIIYASGFEPTFEEMAQMRRNAGI